MMEPIEIHSMFPFKDEESHRSAHFPLALGVTSFFNYVCHIVMIEHFLLLLILKGHHFWKETKKSVHATLNKCTSWCLAYKTSSDEWKTAYTLNIVCGYTEVRHEQPWHMIRWWEPSLGHGNTFPVWKKWRQECPKLTLPSWMVTTSGRPPTTRARSVSTGISG